MLTAMGMLRETEGTRAMKPGLSRPTTPVIERLEARVGLDPYLSLTGLAGYSGLSVRKLRASLTDAGHPLPCYRVGGKILVRRSEFDVWIAAYRRNGRADLDRIAKEILGELTRPSGAAPRQPPLDKGPGS
jgi:hypothetical protein